MNRGEDITGMGRCVFDYVDGAITMPRRALNIEAAAIVVTSSRARARAAVCAH